MKGRQLTDNPYKSPRVNSDERAQRRERFSRRRVGVIMLCAGSLFILIGIVTAATRPISTDRLEDRYLMRKSSQIVVPTILIGLLLALGGVTVVVS